MIEKVKVALQTRRVFIASLFYLFLFYVNIFSLK